MSRKPGHLPRPAELLERSLGTHRHLRSFQPELRRLAVDLVVPHRLAGPMLEHVALLEEDRLESFEIAG